MDGVCEDCGTVDEGWGIFAGCERYGIGYYWGIGEFDVGGCCFRSRSRNIRCGLRCCVGTTCTGRNNDKDGIEGR